MKVHELLADESRWTRGAMARDDQGADTDPLITTACKFCLLGAFYRCYPCNVTLLSNSISKMESAVWNLGYDTIPGFNDAKKTTHADVLKLCRKLDI